MPAMKPILTRPEYLDARKILRFDFVVRSEADAIACARQLGLSGAEVAEPPYHAGADFEASLPVWARSQGARSVEAMLGRERMRAEYVRGYEYAREVPKPWAWEIMTPAEEAYFSKYDPKRNEAAMPKPKPTDKPKPTPKPYPKPPRGFRMAEEIELTPEEDAALDRVNDRIGREKKAKAAAKLPE
jgi:hypothetical protein